MQDFEGDLFYLINEAEKYFLKNIHIGMRVDGLRRVDIPEINKEAFREAIVNALCHRDYWKFDSVNVAVFKDRVEVRSPGLLYGDFTIDKIKQENVSERRNELISKLFYDVHYVENWGRGISKILSLEPDTDFKEVGTHFITVFRRKEVQKYPEKYPEKLNVTQAKIINIIKKEPNISRLGLAKRLYLTDSAIKKNLRILKEKGAIKRVGPAKGGYWEVL